MSFSYDGFLPLAETWSGTVTGTVSRSYDNNFWLVSLSVNSNPISFDCDADGLLIRVGELNLTRDPQHGLLTGTSQRPPTTPTSAPTPSAAPACRCWT